MEIIRSGVEYRLQNFGKETQQTLIFTERTADGLNEGTTNEEVISVLIERFYDLQSRATCHENLLILYHLKEARKLLAKRRDRTARIKQQRRYEKSDNPAEETGV